MRDSLRGAGGVRILGGRGGVCGGGRICTSWLWLLVKSDDVGKFEVWRTRDVCFSVLLMLGRGGYMHVSVDRKSHSSRRRPPHCDKKEGSRW